MSPKDNREPKVEPQTPEEVEDAPSQDDASDSENQEQDGASGKPVTMEERREKMRQLRAKMVRRTTACSHLIY